MHAEGEYVVYGSKGVCLIKQVGPVDIPGADKNKLYYIMQPVQNQRGTVYLPIDNHKQVLRTVISKGEAERLIKDIPEVELLVIADDKTREDHYKQAMRSCDARTWISIIKTLLARKRERIAAGKKITALDDRYLKAAQQELFGELSIALGQSVEDVEQYCRQAMEAV